MRSKHDRVRATITQKAVHSTTTRPSWLDDLELLWWRSGTESLRTAFERHFGESYDAQQIIAEYVNKQEGMTYKLLPKARVVALGKLGHRIYRRK